MKRGFKILAVLVAVAAILVAVVAVPFVLGRPWTLNQFYMRAMLGVAMRSPETLTQMGMLRNVGLRYYEDDLDDYTFEALEEMMALPAEQLDTLRGYDRPEEFEDALSYDAALWTLETLSGLDTWKMHIYTLEPLVGAHTALPTFMTVSHKMRDAEDAEHYVARARQLSRALVEHEARGRRKVDAGFTPPRFLLERVAADTRQFIASKPEDNPLVTVFADKAGKIEELDDERRQSLRADLVAIVSGDVYPAWERFAESMEELAKRAPPEAGVWRLDKGDEYYAWLLGLHTASDMSADEIHELGLKEVARLEAESWNVLAQMGVEPSGSLGETTEALAKRPGATWPNTEAGRTAAQKEYQAIVDSAGPVFDKLFELKPNNTVEVHQVPSYKIDSAPPGYYNSGPLDGSEPGKFFFNSKYMDQIPRAAMRALSAHEAIPGHHFHIFVTRQQEHLPLFRRTLPFSAVTEGWGLYAETLGMEYGFYPTAADRLGYLGAQLFRAARLVVDTGIHHKKWTRQHAIDYLTKYTSVGPQLIELEVNRYCAFPGQATSYMTGQHRILAMRAKAKRELGDKFELRRFHNFFMTGGIIPWQLMERRLDYWLASERKR